MKKMSRIILLLIFAGLLLSGCEDETVSDRLAVSGGGGGGGSASLPAPGSVNANDFPANPDPYEAGGGDNTLATASSITVGGASQPRTVFPAGDEDWIAVTLPSAGTTYEFIANNLSTRGDTFMELYDSGGTFISDNDDLVGFDSEISYVAGSANEQVYVRVFLSPATFYPELPVMTYTLYARTYTDGDLDGFSTFYDCNDADVWVYPWAIEYQGDGLDYNCDGQLTPPDDGVNDGFEPDNTLGAGSKPLKRALGQIYELQLRPEVYKNAAGGGNLHKIENSAAPDTVKFNVPPYSEVYAEVASHFLWGVDGWLYDQGDLVTPIASDTATGWAMLTATNNTASPRDFYIEYKSADATTGVYWPYFIGLGADIDGDGWYTKGGGLGWDCDDGDAAINPGAAVETVSDGIDTNCNGDDDT